MGLGRVRPFVIACLVAVLASSCGDSGDGGDGGNSGDTGNNSGGDSQAEAPDLPEVCQGQDGEGRRVGFANLGESVPFAVLVREGIEQVAEECNIEILNADNELDAQKALDNARTFVTQGADALVEFQVDAGISEAICDIAEDRPMIAIDIPHEPCAVFMGADNRGAGEITGTGAGELAKELWNCEIDAVVTFEGFASGEPSIQRLNGSIAGVQSVCPDLEYGDFDTWAETVPDSIVSRVDADRTEPAFTKGRDWLTAHPDADQVVALCLNEDSCLGFHSAVEQAGRSGQVVFASNGADPSGHDVIRNDEYYAGATGFFPESYGELVIPNIIRMLNGEEPEADPLLMEHVFINADNIGEYYPE